MIRKPLEYNSEIRQGKFHEILALRKSKELGLLIKRTFIISKEQFSEEKTIKDSGC